MPVPPPLTGPTVVLQANALFQYPYVSPELECEFPRPHSQDDIWRFGYTRTLNRTRIGEVKIYGNDTRPKQDTILYTCTNLKYDKYVELNNFILDTLGLPLKITDWYSNVWKGYIINPSDERSEDVDNTLCGPLYTVNFQLMLRLMSWP